MYEVPKWITPSQIALNWTMRSQTMACIIKSSSEICDILGYYTVQSQH
jgi:diketogulonate reductase-like aldo/keto reductase